MILDLAVIGAVVLAFIISARRGLVKSVWKIAALIITIVLVIALRAPAAEYISQTKLSDRIYTAVSDKLTFNDSAPDEGAAGENGSKDEKSGIPQYILSDITGSAEKEARSAAQNGAEIINRELTGQLTQRIIDIIVIVGLFVIIRLLLMAAFMIIDTVTKLPLINQANALLGGLLGAVNMIAVLYIACALLSLFAKGRVIGLIEQSYIVKYFYNYNILLQLIMKI